MHKYDLASIAFVDSKTVPDFFILFPKTFVEYDLDPKSAVIVIIHTDSNACILNHYWVIVGLWI